MESSPLITIVKSLSGYLALLQNKLEIENDKFCGAKYKIWYSYRFYNGFTLCCHILTQFTLETISIYMPL